MISIRLTAGAERNIWSCSRGSHDLQNEPEMRAVKLEDELSVL